MLVDNGVSFSSGGVAAAVPSSRAAAAAAAAPLLPARFLLYLQSGACIVHCCSGHDARMPAARSPIKVDKLGFLMVSMQGQLCAASAELTRLSISGHDIVSVRGPQCSAVAIVEQEALKLVATSDAAAAIAQGASQRSAQSAAAASVQQSLVLQLRLLLRSAEHAFGSSPSPQSSPSLLDALNAEHHRLMDAMLQSDDIHKQMQDAPISNSSDPLSNTRTIPEMECFEAHVRSVMQRGDLRTRWLSQLCAASSGGAQCIAAHLVAPAAAAAPACSSPVLLSHVVPAFTVLNLTGPSNAGVWSVVTEYARALCARRRNAAAAPSSVVISFPLMSPPLRVHLCALNVPIGACCLVVSEIGPAFSAPVESQRNRSAALLSAHWLDAAAIVAAESFASALPSSLLPADHPLSLAQLQQHPRPFAVFESEAAQPPWHMQQHQEEGQDRSGSSTWNRVAAVARSIELDCALPDPSALAAPVRAAALSSPTLSPLVSVSPLSSASPQSTDELHPQETEPLSEQQQSQQPVSAAVLVSSFKPMPPPPRAIPPPSLASSGSAAAPTELSGAGTASFRMRKMHAAASGPSVPATTMAAAPPPGLRPHPPAQSPALPLAPLVSTAGAPRVPSLLFSAGAAAAVDLSMDTPRLETSHAAATPRVNEAVTAKPSQHPSGTGLFPPVDKREAAVAPLTLLDKLPSTPVGSF